jgi:hypothetical protein
MLDRKTSGSNGIENVPSTKMRHGMMDRSQIYPNIQNTQPPLSLTG